MRLRNVGLYRLQPWVFDISGTKLPCFKESDRIDPVAHYIPQSHGLRGKKTVIGVSKVECRMKQLPSLKSSLAEHHKNRAFSKKMFLQFPHLLSNLLWNQFTISFICFIFYTSTRTRKDADDPEIPSLWMYNSISGYIEIENMSSVFPVLCCVVDADAVKYSDAGLVDTVP